MKNLPISRRKALGSLGALSALALLPNCTNSKPIKKERDTQPNFSYCLNTSTIMGHKLGLVKEIELAAKTGYDGIEIWINAIDKFLQEGGSLSTLRKRIDDLGIRVENAIGFAQWIVDDPVVRSAALEQAKTEMDWLAQLDCKRIAAPPAGATDKAGLDLDKSAERFATLMKLGDRMGVIPQLEVWGFSANLFQLSQVLYVAAAAGHPKTRILPDVYHLYKGGSDIAGLKLLNPKVVEIFHMNDYPAIDATTIEDKDRVFTGDGVAPIATILKDLHSKEHPTVLSLELFNRDYWKRPADEIAKMGLARMKASVTAAFQ